MAKSIKVGTGATATYGHILTWGLDRLKCLPCPSRQYPSRQGHTSWFRLSPPLLANLFSIWIHTVTVQLECWQDVIVNLINSCLTAMIRSDSFVIRLKQLVQNFLIGCIPAYIVLEKKEECCIHCINQVDEFRKHLDFLKLTIQQYCVNWRANN